MMTVGDVIQFSSGTTVVLLDKKVHGSWFVMMLRDTDEMPKGHTTYMSTVMLDRGTVYDWDAADHAFDHLHEVYSGASRITELEE